MAESPSSAVPALPGLAVEVVEWLPSGAASGLVRVRGRWIDEGAREDGLPVLAMHAHGAEQRFESLPDARFSRDPSSWRGTYLVPAELVATDPQALWLEWASGARAGLPALARGLEPPPVPAAPERPEEPEDPGGQVIDRAVLAERRARRAEAAERASVRKAAEALKAVEVLELRSVELERRLEEAVAERDALDARGSGSREALSAALASAAALRARSREWQLRLRTNEVTRAGDAVRLAVLEAARRDTSGELDAARREASGRAGELEAARREAADLGAELGAAHAAAAAAGERLEEARLAWDRRREELESALAGVRAELAAAKERLGVEAVARTTLEDELDRERAARAALAEVEQQAGAARAERDAERTAAGHLRIELQSARTSLEDAERQAAAARAERDAERSAAADLRRRLEVALAERDSERTTAADLRSRLEAARAELDAAPGTLADLRSELEAERAARLAAEQALAAAQSPPAPAAPGPDQLERLAREQVAAAAAHEPPDAGRMVADLDAAADALRRRAAAENDDEPAAPDAEPEVEWGGGEAEHERTPVAPGVEPARPAGEAAVEPAWAPPGFEPPTDHEAVEPPAPDAEPLVEWAPPPAARAEPPATAPPVAPPAPSVAPPAADLVAPRAAGPVVVPTSKHPARALIVGSGRREYPLLRGAIVKLAHDDPALAGRLLAALLPAQGAAIGGPLRYDLTIAGTGTFAVAIAGGRASVDRIDRPRSRSQADFHLSAEPLPLAELLAGVEHRIGRFFGPVRVRGRKRRLKALRALPAGTVTLPQAARAGAKLDPELVYHAFAYAVHPSWTRGHSFTVAQAITGDPGETWYLTARDGAGVTVSTTGAEPDATVTMSRPVFDRLLRAEPVPSGDRPVVRGDRDAVALMRAWTLRAQGA